MNLVFSLLLLTTEPRTGGGATGGDDHVVVGGWPRLNSEKTPLGGPSLRVCFLQGWGLSLIPFLISIWPLPGAALAPGVETFIAGSCRSYGRGISSCLQMARTVPSLISRWRGTLAILCNGGLNQILWAAPSRYNAQPWRRRWRSNSASFMLPRFRKPHALRVGKGLFPQARAGTAGPVLARPQDSLWPLRWFPLAKSRQESPPQNRYSPPL